MDPRIHRTSEGVLGPSWRPNAYIKDRLRPHRTWWQWIRVSVHTSGTIPNGRGLSLIRTDLGGVTDLGGDQHTERKAKTVFFRHSRAWADIDETAP